jgi:hypothetical protein
VFVPRTSSTLLATWFWQTEGRSAERVILGVRPSEFILMESLSPSRRVFIGSHSLPPPLWSPNQSFSGDTLRQGGFSRFTSSGGGGRTTSDAGGGTSLGLAGGAAVPPPPLLP